MEHLAETMTDFLLRRKYITEEQTEWCHYMLIKNIMSMRWLFIRSYKSYNRAFSRAWYHYTPIKFFCKCRYFHIVRLLDYSVCSIVCSMRKAVP